MLCASVAGSPWRRSQDHLNLGRKQLNVYFGSIFIRAPRLELKELDDPFYGSSQALHTIVV